MNAPNALLMAQYGTHAVYREKLAGKPPLSVRAAIGVLMAHEARGVQAEQLRQLTQARMLNETFREMLRMEMAPVVQNMRHTPVPMMLPPDSSLPLGMTDGMVRIASAIGQDMAHASFEKDAGIGAELQLGKALGLDRLANAGVGMARKARTAASGKLRPRLPATIPSPPPSMPPASGAVGAARRTPTPTNVPLSQQRLFSSAPPSAAPAPLGTMSRGGSVRPAAGNAAARPTVYAPSGGSVRPAASSTTNAASRPTVHAPETFRPAASPTTNAASRPTVYAPETLRPAPGAVSPSANTPTYRPPAQGQVQSATTPPPSGGQAPGPSGGGGPPGVVDRLSADLGKGQWGWKLPLAGAMIMGGMGMRSAGKAALNYAGQPSQQSVFNAGAAMPAYGVNQYGIPDRGM